MDLKTVGGMLAKVGGSILKNAFPPLTNIAFEAINAVLPANNQLAEDATGDMAMKAVATLPPEQQASLMEKKLEVEQTEIIEFTKVMSVLADADKTGSSTRPAIALMMARVVAFAIIIMVVAWAVAVLTDKTNTLEKLGNAWPLMVAVLGTPTALLNVYFGHRRKEKEARYNMASNSPPKTGWIKDVISAFKS